MELDELYEGEGENYEWREKARWIKFEEDVEEGAERWGKPHVASLSFHSLLELRRGLENGTVVSLLCGPLGLCFYSAAIGTSLFLSIDIFQSCSLMKSGILFS